MRKYQRLLSKSYYPRLLAFRHVTQSYHSRNSKYPGVKKEVTILSKQQKSKHAFCGLYF
ncbi:MAG: reverse transcriptase N-terminal domain-containing protein [Trichodesmium sp. MAG_R01]|nr:reverse transcriptase N-terminal domain-containing protein [Trichodesmium sp. MAG_R01]